MPSFWSTRMLIDHDVAQAVEVSHPLDHQLHVLQGQARFLVQGVPPSVLLHVLQHQGLLPVCLVGEDDRAVRDAANHVQRREYLGSD